MNIAKRIQESEESFKTKQSEREQYLRAAEECLTEMTKLQGEWRVLNELKDSESIRNQVNKQATVIEAVPEKVSK